jgi:hypothetical protein
MKNLTDSTLGPGAGGATLGCGTKSGGTGGVETGTSFSWLAVVTLEKISLSWLRAERSWVAWSEKSFHTDLRPVNGRTFI